MRATSIHIYNMMNPQKKSGTLWVAICYVVALAGAYWALISIETEQTILKTLAADVVATAIVFGFSIAFKNASFYDPYWSVAPLPIAIYWKYQYAPGDWMLQEILLLIIIAWWSIRLTLNWYRGWEGIRHEDWRYGDLKKKTGYFYPLVNFLGIHLFPTLLVFLGCLPIIGFFDSFSGGKDSISNVRWFLFAAGALTGFIAPIIQFIADEQMRKHRQSSQNNYIDSGLWKYSRHPNYFGEILFWTSLLLMGLSSANFQWWMASGVVAMILLFVFISSPMMEQRILEKYPDYIVYQKKVSMLIPWFRKK